ncbi:MAG: transposase [Bacteroidota bacterium]
MSKIYQPKRLRTRRNLPHWQAPDGIYTIIFRLKGSLPKAIIERLRDERAFHKKSLLKRGLSKEETAVKLRKMQRLYYGKFDTLLDNTSTGPHFLKVPQIAQIVADAIMHFDGKRYQVIDYCIMSNHVHLTFCQLTKELGDILGSIKKFSSRQINLLQDCVGRQVWMQESYDHLIRDWDDLAFYHTYNINNPVSAGIVMHWTDYPFTYANPDYEEYYLSHLP